MSHNSHILTDEKARQSAQILGIPIFSRSRAELLREVTGWVEEKIADSAGKRLQARMKLVFTPNPEILVEASGDREFGEVLKGADINIPDGVGVKLAGGVVGQTISAVLPGTDIAHDLVLEAAKRGWRVYFLGARPGVAQRAAQMLEIEAREAGFEVHSQFAWEADAGPSFARGFGRYGLGLKTGRSTEEAIRKINKFRPDLLLVAFGQGKQERWLMANRGRLKARVGMVVGGAFDFWSGRAKRAPGWVRGLGFEWLYRLLREPWRWRRQLRLLEFGWLVLMQKMRPS